LEALTAKKQLTENNPKTKIDIANFFWILAESRPEIKMGRVWIETRNGAGFWKCDATNKLYLTETGDEVWETSGRTTSARTTSGRTRARSRSKAPVAEAKVTPPSAAAENLQSFGVLFWELYYGLRFFGGMMILTGFIMFVMLPSRPTEVLARAASCHNGMRHMLSECLAGQEYRKCFAATQAAIANGTSYERIVKTCNYEPVHYITPCMTYTKVGKWVINHTLATRRAADFDVCTFNDVQAVVVDTGLYCTQEPQGLDDGCESVIEARESAVDKVLKIEMTTFATDVQRTTSNIIFSILAGVDLTSAITVQVVTRLWSDGTFAFTTVETVFVIFNMVWALLMSRCINFNVSAASIIPVVMMLITDGPLKLFAFTGIFTTTFMYWVMSLSSITSLQLGCPMFVALAFKPIVRTIGFMVKNAGFQLTVHVAVGIVFYWVR